MNQTCQLCGGHEPPFTIHPEGTRHTQPIESCIRELARRCRILDETTTRWKVVEAPVADLPNGPKQRTCEKCGHAASHMFFGDSDWECSDERSCLTRQLSAAIQRAEMLDRELLRVKTTQHGAAHALDNLGIELGCGHSARIEHIVDAVRGLNVERDEARAELKKMAEAGRCL